MTFYPLVIPRKFPRDDTGQERDNAGGDEDDKKLSFFFVRAHTFKQKAIFGGENEEHEHI